MLIRAPSAANGRTAMPAVPQAAAKAGVCSPTEANFVWLRLGEYTPSFAAACETAGIAVRPFAAEGARISIGDQEANDALLAVAHAFPHRHA